MDHTQSPSFRLTSFLAGMRGSVSAGCRSSSSVDPKTVDRIELRYQEALDGPERMLGLRAELRDGVPVIVLYEESQLRPPSQLGAP